jgi:hypothetical protein
MRSSTAAAFTVPGTTCGDPLVVLAIRSSAIVVSMQEAEITVWLYR